ncbi:Uncharacterized protein dnm_096490 [Desulfonema magnum]|uniref:Uncharacterized protein n=1 Tax=Desulfonema magnum TaxID=45655 RepID=A0A975BY98_9BACT|nr:Uncharacterized protein dnm_096490 [Desulfonema magnum]
MKEAGGRGPEARGQGPAFMVRCDRSLCLFIKDDSQVFGVS